MLKRVYAAVAIMLASGCGARGPEAQTQVAQIDALNTQIADLHLTATAEADHMAITMEHAQTEVSRAQNQGTALASTLVARGFDPLAIANITPVVNIPVPTQPASSNPGSVLPQATEEADGSPIPITPFTITPSLPPPARLSNIVMAEGVGDNDCALAAVTQFRTSSERIYVVAVANNVPEGATISYRWQQDGVERAHFDWTPDFYIEQACIWYFIEPSDVAFTPGSWSVVLEIDGQATGGPASFSIVE